MGIKIMSCDCNDPSCPECGNTKEILEGEIVEETPIEEIPTEEKKEGEEI
jgi:hypothetical protein